MGDYFGADYYVRAKTVASVTTLLSGAIDGAIAQDASLVGTVITLSASTNTVTVEVNASAMAAGGSAVTDWQVSLLAESNVYTLLQPSQVPGFELDLDASKGVTQVALAVSQWNDSSGFGDPNHNVTQAVGVNQPLLNKSNSNFNGRPTIDFNGNSYMLSGSWAHSVAQPFTVFMVGSNVSAGVAVVFDNLAPGTRTDIQGAGPTGSIPELYAGAGPLADSSGASFASPTVMGALFNGAASQLWLNQRTGQATGAGGADSPLEGTTIGCISTSLGADGWTGSIARILVYSGVLSPQAVAGIMDYLGSEYGVSIAS